MKYVITGSLGHVSKPVSQALIAAGHQVSIITSNNNKKQEIENLGATALVGSVDDGDFINNAFTGADAVYLMVPPNFKVANWPAYQVKVADAYVNAVNNNGIKQVVLLSSIGAHLKKGAGPVDGLAYLEDKLTALKDVNAVFLRPGYFYYNLLNQVNIIKHAGIVTSAQPASQKMVLTHPADIAATATTLLLKCDFKGKQVQYISSDDTNTWQDITAALTAAINKQGVPYVESGDEQSRAAMQQAGLPETIIDGYVAMGQALRSGGMQEDYWAHKPAASKIKLADFAKEFAVVYQGS